jgi:transposase
MTECCGGDRQRRKKPLTAEQKCELWTALVRGDATQRQLADRSGVDRTTVAKVADVAKHGALSALTASKPGRPTADDPHEQELREHREEIARPVRVRRMMSHRVRRIGSVHPA